MSVSDRLDQPDAVAWKPVVGDKLVGRIVALDERESDYGGRYPVVIVEQMDGTTVAVHAYHSVLKNELGRQRPAVDDEIGILYRGRQTGQAGTSYESYRLVVDRAEAKAVDWQRYDDAEPVQTGESDLPADDDDIPF